MISQYPALALNLRAHESRCGKARNLAYNRDASRNANIDLLCAWKT